MDKGRRYEINPFLPDMILDVRPKGVRLTPMGSNNHILVDQRTGEFSGTHVVARKKVDTERFVKTFADYMAFTFDLTKAGNKALRVLMWAVQQEGRGKDRILLDIYTLRSFLSQHGFSEADTGKDVPGLSYPTFRRGLGELIKAKIIAKTMRKAEYFINPNCIFNGDRVAFTTVIERETGDDGDAHLQADLPLPKGNNIEEEQEQ